jgi:hypothetical protein
MPFGFKLPKRLAIAWRARSRFLLVVAALLPHLPVESRLTLIAFSHAVSLRPFWSDIGNRRRCQLRTTERRRLGDTHPCWEFFISRVVVRVAILAIPKVAA